MGYSWYRVDGAAADHPKVMELAALLKAEIALADGYVMRLWSWAQRYAASGVFSARVVPQLELYLGREGLIALMAEVGLVDADGDEFCVHDWKQMQSSLVQKSSRDAEMKRVSRRGNGARRKSAARTPAPQGGAQPALATDETDGRNERDVTNERKEERPAPVASDLMALWNSTAAKPLPRCIELTDKREVAARARLADRSLAQWGDVIARINASAFCCGQNDRAWVATFDWLLQPDVAVKVLEGKYDNRGPPAKPEPVYAEGRVRL